MNKKKYKRKKHTKKYVEWIEREPVKADKENIVKDTKEDIPTIKDSFASLEDTFKEEVNEENTNIASLEEMDKEPEKKED